MTQGISENQKDDTGYYTPKNILNPAMFRLAEITRALSEVNMEIEQEKLFEDRRHTINVEEYNHEEEEDKRSEPEIEVIEEKVRLREPSSRSGRWIEVLERNEDQIGKALLISLFISIVFLIVLLLLWS